MAQLLKKRTATTQKPNNKQPQTPPLKLATNNDALDKRDDKQDDTPLLDLVEERQGKTFTPVFKGVSLEQLIGAIETIKDYDQYDFDDMDGSMAYDAAYEVVFNGKTIEELGYDPDAVQGARQTVATQKKEKEERNKGKKKGPGLIKQTATSAAKFTGKHGAKLLGGLGGLEQSKTGLDQLKDSGRDISMKSLGADSGTSLSGVGLMHTMMGMRDSTQKAGQSALIGDSSGATMNEDDVSKNKYLSEKSLLFMGKSVADKSVAIEASKLGKDGLKELTQSGSKSLLASKLLGVGGHAHTMLDAGKKFKKNVDATDDLKAMKTLGAIVTARGKGWAQRVENRANAKKAMQVLRAVGAALGIAAVLATGPVALIVGIVSAVVGIGIMGAKFVNWISRTAIGKLANLRATGGASVGEEQTLASNDSKDDKEVDAKTLKTPDEEVKVEDKVEDTVEVETKRGRLGRMSDWMRGGNKQEREALKEHRSTKKAESKRMKKERKNRIKLAKQYRSDAKKLKKVNKRYAKTWSAWKLAENKGKSEKASKLLNKLKVMEEQQVALAKKNLPMDKLQGAIEDASHVVQHNSQAAQEMRGALGIGTADSESKELADREHSDAGLLTDVLGVSEKEALSASGQALLERRLSAFDGT